MFVSPQNANTEDLSTRVMACGGDSRHMINAPFLQDGHRSQNLFHDRVRGIRNPLQLSTVSSEESSDQLGIEEGVGWRGRRV